MTEIYFYISLAISVIILIVTIFNTGKIVSLQKHNSGQDTDIHDIRKDLVEIEKDIETISEGQARMYSDFKGTLENALKPVIDSNNRQAERLDRVLEMFAQQGSAKR